MLLAVYQTARLALWRACLWSGATVPSLKPTAPVNRGFFLGGGGGESSWSRPRLRRHSTGTRSLLWIIYWSEYALVRGQRIMFGCHYAVERISVLWSVLCWNLKSACDAVMITSHHCRWRHSQNTLSTVSFTKWMIEWIELWMQSVYGLSSSIEFSGVD